MKIDASRFAFTAAIVSAISTALLPVYCLYFGRGGRVITVLAGIFPGYTVSWQGAGLGFIYGFVSCFVYGGIFALIYNALPAFKVKNIKTKPKAKPVSKKKKK